MKTLSVKSLFRIVLGAVFLWCAAMPAAASAGQGAGDALITSKVKTAFFQEPMLRTSFLNVSTKGGVVQLTGSVERPFDLAVATELARTVADVVEVRNELVAVRDHTAHGR